MPANQSQSTYSARTIILVMLAIWLVLVTSHISVMVVHYKITKLPWLFRELFDLDEEQSFGTWFSAINLLFAGVLVLHYASKTLEIGGHFRRHWIFLGFGFLVLSIDEMVGLHETLNSLIDISWTIPLAVIVFPVGLAFLPFLARLPRPTSLAFICAGALFLGGAMGIELWTESYADAKLLKTLEYNLTTVLEEAMEMLGIILFIYAFLNFTQRTSPHLSAMIDTRSLESWPLSAMAKPEEPPINTTSKDNLANA